MANGDTTTDPWLAAAARLEELPTEPSPTRSADDTNVPTDTPIATRGTFAVPTPPSTETVVETTAYEDAVELKLSTATGYVTALLSPADAACLARQLETTAAEVKTSDRYSSLPATWPAGDT